MSSPFPLLEPKPTFWVSPVPSVWLPKYKQSFNPGLQHPAVKWSNIFFWQLARVLGWYTSAGALPAICSAIPRLSRLWKEPGKELQKAAGPALHDWRHNTGSWVLMCTTGPNEDLHWVPAGLQNLVALPDNVDSLRFALHQVCWHFLATTRVITNCPVHYWGSSHPSLYSPPKQRAELKFPIPPTNKKQSLRTIWCLKNAGTVL